MICSEGIDASGRAIATMNEAATRDHRLDAIIVPARDGMLATKWFNCI